MLDVIIVVHNQHEYYYALLESLKACTTVPYTLLVWDNASDPPIPNATVRNETNVGDVYPNNRLVAMGTSEYVCLLNSDTYVKPGWERELIRVLDMGYAAVGYQGMMLKDWIGHTAVYRTQFADYINGHCLAFKRTTFDIYGLFDERFQFGYCQDADFGLMLRSKGEQIYALGGELVYHYGGRTVASVPHSQDNYIRNHELLRSKWGQL